MNELYLKYRQQGVFRKEQLTIDFTDFKHKPDSLKYKLRDAKRSQLVKSVSGRRGIYFIVEPGEDYKKAFADSYKLAANIAKGAIICYASALSFYGKSHSIHNIIYISSPQRFRELRYNGILYQYVTLPYQNLSVEEIHYKGVTIKVTSLERTLVDCLRNLKYAGGFEQLYRSFEGVQYLNYNSIEKYLLKFSSSVLIARVGLFLEFFKSKWGIQDTFLNRLQKKISSHPDYFLGREFKTGKLIHKWNLIVPQEVLNMGGYHVG